MLKKKETYKNTIITFLLKTKPNENNWQKNNGSRNFPCISFL